MEVELSKKSIKALAIELAKVLKKGVEPDLITPKEAAERLGISLSRLYHIKDRLPHTKLGTNKQGPLRFYSKGLMDAYMNKEGI